MTPKVFLNETLSEVGANFYRDRFISENNSEFLDFIMLHGDKECKKVLEKIFAYCNENGMLVGEFFTQIRYK